MVMEPVRLGVIGCGVMGARHLNAAQKTGLYELTAVADPVEEQVRKTVLEYGVKKSYSDGAALLEDSEVEAVILALPTNGRTELALKAFAKGKHVLTEKPVAMNAAEVRQLIKARKKLIAGCCSSRHRFLPGNEAAANFIASGALGDLRMAHCRCINAAAPKPEKSPPAWRLIKSFNGGGILVNWGCYDMDFLLGITDWTMKPEVVLAQTWKVAPVFEPNVAPGSDAETYYAALIRCTGGAVLSMERGEYMPAQSDNSWHIVGARGSLTLNMTPGAPKKLVFDEGSTEKGVVSKVIWEGEESSEVIISGPVKDFALAIRERRQPKTSLENALVVQAITDAIYLSAEQNKAVKINLKGVKS